MGDEMITFRLPRSDIVGIGALLLTILFGSSQGPSSSNSCIRDLNEPKEAILFDSFQSGATSHSRVAVRRTRSALHVRVVSGTVRFNRRNTQARVAGVATIVTTEQVQISHVDGTLCVRAQGDRTSIAVLDGVAQVSALELKERSVGNGRVEAAGHESFAMRLRSGDRAEVFRRGSDLVIRLEGGTGGAAMCSLIGDWGGAVLEWRVG